MSDELTLRFEHPGDPPLEISSAWLIDESNAQYVAGLVKLDDHTASLDLGEVANGRYWLSATIENHPTLRFTITIKGDTERTVEFHRYTPRCATITMQRASAGADKSRRVHAVNIALPAKHSAVVMVAGFDHHSFGRPPTDYSVFARKWRNDLYYGVTDAGGTPNQKIKQAVFEHTVVTTFDFATGDVREQIRGAGGWHTMYEWMCGKERPYQKDAHTDESGEIRKKTDSISITDVYAYISKLGQDAPASLTQLHFFGHAFPGAPILLNTNDDIGFKSPERDPGDKDPRAKDFYAANLNLWPHLKNAFARDALVKSWGCSADGYLKDRILAVLHTKSPTEEVEHTYQTITREMVMMDIDDVVSGSYLMACIDNLGVDAWGSAPSTTSIYKRGYEYVDQSQFGIILRWYEKHYGGRRDVTGHFPYRRLKFPGESEP